MEKILYLDMDGCFVNFSEGWFEYKKITPNKDDLSKWNFSSRLGYTHDSFVQDLMTLPVDFWENLKPFEWAEELYEYCLAQDFDKFIFLTHAIGKNSAIGKAQWVKNIFPNHESGIITVKKSEYKKYFANSDATLLDDKFSNCCDFLENNGSVLILDQPWNKFNFPQDFKNSSTIIKTKIEIEHKEHKDFFGNISTRLTLHKINKG